MGFKKLLVALAILCAVASDALGRETILIDDFADGVPANVVTNCNQKKLFHYNYNYSNPSVRKFGISIVCGGSTVWGGNRTGEVKSTIPAMWHGTTELELRNRQGSLFAYARTDLLDTTPFVTLRYSSGSPLNLGTNVSLDLEFASIKNSTTGTMPIHVSILHSSQLLEWKGGSVESHGPASISIPLGNISDVTKITLRFGAFDNPGNAAAFQHVGFRKVAFSFD